MEILALVVGHLHELASVGIGDKRLEVDNGFLERLDIEREKVAEVLEVARESDRESLVYRL